MPFDAMPAEVLDDLARLRIVRDGVSRDHSWCKHELGGRAATQHCLLGWLLVATDWDAQEATRLAFEHLYPALPPSARNENAGVMSSLYQHNDYRGRGAILAVIDRAIERLQ